jgi:cobalt/nickel transport protein
MTEQKESGAKKSVDIVIAAGIAISLGIAVFAPFYASTYPDGLDSTFLTLYGAKNPATIHIDEKKVESAQAAVMENTGNSFSWEAPFTDYSLPGLDKSGEVLAIAFGVLVLFILGLGLTRFIARRN